MSGVYYQMRENECVCLLTAAVQGVGVSVNSCSKESGCVY